MSIKRCSWLGLRSVTDKREKKKLHEGCWCSIEEKRRNRSANENASGHYFVTLGLSFVAEKELSSNKQKKHPDDLEHPFHSVV